MTQLPPSDSQNIKKTGLSNTGEPVFVVVGKLRRPHGIRGEMKMTVLTDFPETLKNGRKTFVGDKHHPLTIRSTRWAGGDMLIAFEEYYDRDEVGVHRNQMLSVHAEDLPPLPEGVFHTHELVGIKVITEDGQNLGILDEILETGGANDVFIVKKPHEKDILLPAIEDVILEIDLEKGEMLVHILPGLL